MKKINIIISFLAIIIAFFNISSYAVSLSTINIKTDKNNIKPGEEVELIIDFGTELSTYTINISYDNNIFDYISADAGTAQNNGNSIKIIYDGTSAGVSRRNMNIIFKAKEELISSNPTEFTLVGENIKNSDLSIEYDNITTPIIENIIVEPEYKDYNIELSYEGELIKERKKDMILTFSSSMGRFFEKARLVAEVTTPDGGIMSLTGINSQENVEQDLIKSGWGDPQGYPIGGKDYSQVLNLNSLFSKEGEYLLKLKLIDRKNSDNIISEKEFKLDVLSESKLNQNLGSITNTQTEEDKTTITQTQLPTTLPKTGFNFYIPIGIISVFIIVLLYYKYKIKNQKK